MRQPRTGGGGGGGTADWSYFRNVGTAAGLGERWYPANLVNNVNPTTVNTAHDTLYAVPIVEARGGTVDRIGFYMSALLVGNARLGIYQATSATNLYPNTLVVDAGAAALVNGLNSRNINQVLTAGTLYWLAMITSVDTNPAPPYALPLTGTLPQLGVSNAFVQWSWCSVAQAYGALPANFPAGAALLSTTPLMIAVRYSA